MKTTLIDVVKMNGNSANASRIKSATPKNVETKEFRSATDNSDQSFNKTLKEEQKSSESKFEVTSKKPEKTPEKEMKEVKKEESKEQEETVTVEGTDRQPEETEVVEKAEEQGTFAHSEESKEESDAVKTPVEESIEDNDGEVVKTKTLMSLLSGEKKSKYPQVERYISNLRSEGKSTKEILTSLKKVVNDLEEKPELSLKDYVLKAKKILTEENGEMKNEVDTAGEKKTVVTTEVETTKAKEVETEETSDATKLLPKKVIVKNDEQKQKPAKAIVNQDSNEQAKTIIVQTERNEVKDSEPRQNTQVAKTTAKASDVQMTKPVKEDLKTTLKTEMEIPEKLVKFIENYEKVDFEKISSFFESKLIPVEEIENFINSFNFDNGEDFVERNESILSQLSEFSKLFDATKTSNIFTQAKRVTIKTTVVQQFIAKSFNQRSFSDEFWNNRSNMLFKTKTSSHVVQKMTVSFERITQSVRTEIRGTQNTLSQLNSREGELMQRDAQSPEKPVVKAAFMRTGYESPINRRGALTQTTETTIVREETVQKTEVFQSPLKQIDELKESVEKLQSRGVENNNTKISTEAKETKEQLSGENANHSTEKTTTSFTSTALNRQVVNASNLEQVYQRISDMTKLMERQMTKVETVTIQLTPPELGKVSMEVVKEGSRISIFMQVETKDAQEMLQKNSETLAARLSGSGFELQKVTVQMEKFEEQGTDQQNQNADSQNKQNNENSENNSNESASDYDNEAEYSFADLLKGGIEDVG